MCNFVTRVCFIVSSLIYLNGCANNVVVNYLDGPISAIPVSAVYTGWILNHCDSGKPTVDSELNCFQHGGEIYVVDIVRAKNKNGELIASFDKILVVQHALMVEAYNRKRWCFDITKSSGNLEQYTGIKYIATSYQRNCN
jgi:hypothetical protein